MQYDAAFHGFDVFPASDAQSEEHDQEQERTPRPRRPPVTAPPLGPDNTNRTHLDLPPVVNGRLQYANKQLKYRPFPSDVDEIRDKLFKLEQPVLLNSQQIADYWTHMSNVYMRSTKPTLEANGAVIESWECRNRRRVTLGKEKEKARPSLGMRNKKNKTEALEELGACRVRVKVTTYTKHAKDCDSVGFLSCKCIPEWAYLDRTGQSKSNDFHHTHDIGVCDKFKRSNALMYACKIKVEEGYKYQAVGKWIREKYGSISKEVDYLSKQDISNVSKYWRMINQDVELRPEIVEDDSQGHDREGCMDAIEISSADQLRKALIEVCARLPQAADIIRPFLETPQLDGEEEPKILEGRGLEVPPPGLPSRRYNPPTREPQPPTSQTSLPPHPPPPGPPPVLSVQVNGEPVPPGAHPLHVPAHLVPRYLHSQAGLPQNSYALHESNGSPIQNVTPYQIPVQTPPPPPPIRQPEPPPTSMVHLLRHGSAPNVRPRSNGIRDDRPSWATPQKRSADAVATESLRPSKRPDTTDDINTQLQRELQS